MKGTDQRAGKGTIDRRTLLQLIGTAGATMTATTACGTVFGKAPAEGLPAGAEFEKSVTLATAGPGGNKAWRPGDYLQFLPAERIPTSGKASTLLASQTKAKLLELHELMLRNRVWERAIRHLYLDGTDGLKGSFHQSTGQEAIPVGVMGALRPDDYMASTHRGHADLIAKDADLNKMSAEMFLKTTGYNKGYGGSMHITDISKNALGANGIVGASFYMAAGAGLHALARQTKQVSVAFFGDGAAASPYYFSAVRSCLNNRIPTLFVCENNLFWVSQPVAFSSPTKYICDYTKGLGIPHYLVDGNDITAVYAAAHEAAEWARAGNGPSVIEGITYRWYDHSGLAGAKKGQEGAMGMPYRTDEEVRQWMSRDPILRYKQWLLAKGLATEGDITAVEKKVQAAVDASIEFARKSPWPQPEDGALHTFANERVKATQFYNRKGFASHT